MRSAQPIVFGASAYANAVPLSRFLADVCPDVRIVQDVPSALPAQLLAGTVDVALVPVASLLTGGGMEMISGIGVCARGEVRSVLLKLWRPVPRVRTVAADPASRTSNALARILLKQRHGVRALVRPAADGEYADAAVAIGDRALCEPPAPCGALDLGAEWNALTGLPFVFAVWACRAGDSRKEPYARIAQDAMELGVQALPRLAESESERLRLPAELCRDYFSRCIHYRVGPEEMEAIRRFGELLHDE